MWGYGRSGEVPGDIVFEIGWGEGDGLDGGDRLPGPGPGPESGSGGEGVPTQTGTETPTETETGHDHHNVNDDHFHDLNKLTDNDHGSRLNYGAIIDHARQHRYGTADHGPGCVPCHDSTAIYHTTSIGGADTTRLSDEAAGYHPIDISLDAWSYGGSI